VPSFLCKTCATQFPESDEPPAACPICSDERQYVPEEGQQWVTYDDVRASHRADIREEEPRLTGIGVEPQLGIGQRALLVESPSGNVLWDCVPLLDDMASFVESRGGLRGVAISHPHYYTTMVEWAHRFECPVLIHELEREWIQRPDDAIELWSGDVRELWDDLTLLRLGGHFAGGQVLHWREGAALLSGDIVQVLPGSRWGRGDELVEQLKRRCGDGLDGTLECGLVRLRRLAVPADLAHELKRGGARLLLADRGLDVVERVDAAAHC